MEVQITRTEVLNGYRERDALFAQLLYKANYERWLNDPKAEPLVFGIITNRRWRLHREGVFSWRIEDWKIRLADTIPYPLLQWFNALKPLPMPYDPTHPINGEIVDADELREKFDYVNARIDSIPEGPPGPAGEPGPPGNDGAPGEVTFQQLNEAIAGTALNPHGSAAFPGTFSDSVTQAEMLAYVAWNEARWQAITRPPT